MFMRSTMPRSTLAFAKSAEPSSPKTTGLAFASRARLSLSTFGAGGLIVGKHSRNKGATFERQIAKRLRELWPEARRRGNAQADGQRIEADVEGTPYHIECKRYAARPSWDQCVRWFADIPRDGRPPLLIVKADRQPAMVMLEVDRLGLVCMPLSSWMTGAVGVDSIEVIWRD